MNILNTILRLPRLLLLCTLREQLEFRHWEFDKSADNEMYFILHNYEIFTNKLDNEHLIETILDVVFSE